MKTSSPSSSTPSVSFPALAVMSSAAITPRRAEALAEARRLAKAIAVAAVARRNAATAIAFAQSQLDAAEVAHATAVAAWDEAFS